MKLGLLSFAALALATAACAADALGSADGLSDAAPAPHAAKVSFVPGEVIELLRSPLTEELATATNAVPANRRLILALRRAVALLDAGSETNLTTDVTLLSRIATTISGTPAMTNLSAPLRQVVGIFAHEIESRAAAESNRLRFAFPSAYRELAGRSFAPVHAFAGRAGAHTNALLACRNLSSASSKLAVTRRLTSRALAVAPPSAVVGAAVAAPGLALSYRAPNPSVTELAPGRFVINSLQRISSRRGVELREVRFSLPAAAPGANPSALVNSAFLSISNRLGVQQFVDGSGAAQFVWDPDRRAIAGKFQFIGLNLDTAEAGEVAGTFSGRY